MSCERWVRLGRVNHGDVLEVTHSVLHPVEVHPLLIGVDVVGEDSKAVQGDFALSRQLDFVQDSPELLHEDVVLKMALLVALAAEEVVAIRIELSSTHKPMR